MAGAIDKGDVAEDVHCSAAAGAFAGRFVFFVGGEGFVTAGAGAGGVVAFVDLTNKNYG